MSARSVGPPSSTGGRRPRRRGTWDWEAEALRTVPAQAPGGSERENERARVLLDGHGESTPWGPRMWSWWTLEDGGPQDRDFRYLYEDAREWNDPLASGQAYREVWVFMWAVVDRR